MKVLLNVICLLLLFLIVGCTHNDAVSEYDSSNLEKKILELEQTIKKQKATIKEHEEQIAKVEEMESKVNKLETLTSHLNNMLFETSEILNYTTTSKTAILNKAEIVGDKLNLNITYTDKIKDENGPNGFRLEETGKGTVALGISKGVPVFLLATPSTLTEVEWEQVIDHKGGLLKLFEKNGEVVFIKEMYLP